eukprot:TRINITY_DN423_c0_g1_i1.p1 TRINITY_DN423_c0_g1~~TRINITY_DN423_c0_g1_i1.p1  ORF type:complete len:219 (-),score=92.89 TRINITY_DN423_c0_g1_i1:116-772(-)
MQSQYKLTYFNGAGRADPIRLAFAIGNIPFEDERLNYGQFIERKENGCFRFGKLPQLSIDNNKIFTQAIAIVRFVGKLAGLYPTNIIDQLRIDEILDVIHEIVYNSTASYYEEDINKKKLMREKLVEENILPIFKILNNLLKENGSNGSFIGDQITIAELWVYTFVQFHIKDGLMQFIDPNLFNTNEFEEINKLVNKIHNHPKVNEYYNKNVVLFKPE